LDLANDAQKQDSCGRFGSGQSRWKNLPRGWSDALVGVRAEVVALGLEEVGGKAGGAVAVVVGEGALKVGTGTPHSAASATTLRQLAWAF
jgi:hypothetical protein